MALLNNFVATSSPGQQVRSHAWSPQIAYESSATCHLKTIQRECQVIVVSDGAFRSRGGQDNTSNSFEYGMTLATKWRYVNYPGRHAYCFLPLSAVCCTVQHTWLYVLYGTVPNVFRRCCLFGRTFRSKMDRVLCWSVNKECQGVRREMQKGHQPPRRFYPPQSYFTCV
jgi:hypothetical protein